MPREPGEGRASSTLFMIASDIHFWIPLIVLLAGLLLLHKLR